MVIDVIDLNTSLWISALEFSFHPAGVSGATFCTLIYTVDVFSLCGHGPEFSKVSAVSFGRLGLIKRLTAGTQWRL